MESIYQKKKIKMQSQQESYKTTTIIPSKAKIIIACFTIKFSMKSSVWHKNQV